MLPAFSSGHPAGVVWPRGIYRPNIGTVISDRDPGEVPAPPAVAFRRSLYRWWMVLLTSVVPGLLFLSGMLVSSTHGWEKIASGAVVAAFALLGIRTARLGIFAEPEQLVVRDYFRSYHVLWSEIASFEMPPPYGTRRKVGLKISLTDGRLISATLYGRTPLDSGRRPRAVIQELDRLRRQRIRDWTVHPQSPATGPGTEQPL
jgi:hypothetical protein